MCTFSVFHPGRDKCGLCPHERGAVSVLEDQDHEFKGADRIDIPDEHLHEGSLQGCPPSTLVRKHLYDFYRSPYPVLAGKELNPASPG